MENISLYQGLTKVRRERHEKKISEYIQKDGDLTSYNYPYNDTLDKKIHETGRDLDIEYQVVFLDSFIFAKITAKSLPYHFPGEGRLFINQS